MNWRTLLDRRFGVALLILLGLILALSPAGTRKASSLTPQALAETITNEGDHLAAEELAKWLIDKKPDLLIVDLRSAEEFAQYHIPDAVNIPFTKLFEPEAQEILSNDKTIVLYSNGGTHAAQAWVLLQQMNIESYALLGGLNYWTEAILQPKAPNALAADPEILKYQFQKSAAGYFAPGGAVSAPTDSAATTSKSKVQIDPNKKKKARAGC